MLTYRAIFTYCAGDSVNVVFAVLAAKMKTWDRLIR